MGKMGLSAEQVPHYQDEGYLVFEALIQGETWERAMAVFHELVACSRAMTRSEGHYNLAPDAAGKPIPGRLHKIQGVCVADARVLDLARAPEILDRVESLIG